MGMRAKLRRWLEASDETPEPASEKTRRLIAEAQAQMAEREADEEEDEEQWYTDLLARLDRIEARCSGFETRIASIERELIAKLDNALDDQVRGLINEKLEEKLRAVRHELSGEIANVSAELASRLSVVERKQQRVIG